VQVVMQAMFVETEVFWQIRLIMPELPLADDARGVARPLKEIAKGGHSRIEVAKFHVVAHVRLAGQKLHARRCAIWLGVTMREARALIREGVKHRGLIRFATIRAEAFSAEIINENDDDVKLVSRVRGEAERQREKESEEILQDGIDFVNDASLEPKSRGF
jgi:hypothetical protein